MRGAIIHAAGDVRFEERPDPVIVEPTDAVIRTIAACVCGSDLWRYRGISPVPRPTPIGHEYVGIVESVGDALVTVKPGDFVVGGFLHSDNTCPLCRKGMHASCQHGGPSRHSSTHDPSHHVPSPHPPEPRTLDD